MSRTKSSQKLFVVELRLDSGKTREVHVQASTIEVAAARAMKKVPSATAIMNVEQQ